MSFFGFDTTRDPFSAARPADDDEGIDFEDTYDGLGDQLDESDDVFNDDTFGGVATTTTDASRNAPVGKDFDFFGSTARVSDAIGEEQLRYARQPPSSRTPTQANFMSQGYAQQQQPTAYAQQSSRAYNQPYDQQPQRFAQPGPSKSGYERYKDPEYLRELAADESIWGGPKKVDPPAAAVATPSRKMMSLEEVEAAMRANRPVSMQPPVPPTPTHAAGYHQDIAHYSQEPETRQQYRHEAQSYPPPAQVQILQRSQPIVSTPPAPPPAQPIATVLPPLPTSQFQLPQAPVQILQNPDRQQGQQPMQSGQPPLNSHQGHGPTMSQGGRGPIITHPNQLAGLTEEQRNAFLQEDAKRAKRNHKIAMLSKDNGIMTPQDKNFITRIQLQQLVTATGGLNDAGIDSALAEDFYYQVHNQIRGGPRQNPNQPLSNFAQTYLYQTGGRHNNMRRHGRGGDNHVQRMEQQVQRAVEAAKNKPKNKQLVIEGSLGKISFSNAKTPKPLLNIKRNDSESTNIRKAQVITGDDRKTVLRSIENVYATLMLMEDHDRTMPPPPIQDDINPELVGLHMDWQARADQLNSQLWHNLKVHEPVGATTTHPFIAFLSFAKGKKAIPRVFRHVNQEQRTTILTMIAYHLDQLDVIRLGHLQPGEMQLATSAREAIELFSLAVMPSLFGYFNEAGLDIVDGVLGLILAKTSLSYSARTRIGVSMLTMILSRAELIKQAGSVNEQQWDHW